MKRFFVAICCAAVALTVSAQEPSIVGETQIQAAQSIVEAPDSEATFTSAPQDVVVPEVPSPDEPVQDVAPAQDAAPVADVAPAADDVVESAQPPVVDQSVIDMSQPVDPGQQIMYGGVVNGSPCNACGQMAAPYNYNAPAYNGGCSSCGNAAPAYNGGCSSCGNAAPAYNSGCSSCGNAAPACSTGCNSCAPAASNCCNDGHERGQIVARVRGRVSTVRTSLRGRLGGRRGSDCCN